MVRAVGPGDVPPVGRQGYGVFDFAERTCAGRQGAGEELVEASHLPGAEPSNCSMSMANCLTMSGMRSALPGCSSTS
jgi:hypothetical protein